MKRTILMLMILALLLSGCGGASPEEVAGTVETLPAETESSVSMGRLEGGTYINEYTGYGCTLDSSWTFYAAEELQELPENVGELIEGSELGEHYDSLNQFTDMLAENVEDMVTINVLYRRQSMQERLENTTMSEEAVITGILAMRDQMAEAYLQAGFEMQSMEKVKVTFLGEERTALRTQCLTQGVPYITLQIIDNNLGQYAVTLTLASYVEDNTLELLDLFYKTA